jgi:F1F0 ATPase subunit 2
MNEAVSLSGVLLEGLLLGVGFFGGLWWTVQKGLTAKNPALWFFGSTLLRVSLVLGGFSLIARDDWRALLVGLLGFVIARMAVTRFTRPTKKGIHAPQ